jgi:hypothetical protein
MLTYVVAPNRAQLLDYCERARIHPRATVLVQSPADLAAANLGENRIVFYGDYQQLPKLSEIVYRAKTQLLEDVAKLESRLPPRRASEQLSERRN